MAAILLKDKRGKIVITFVDNVINTRRTTTLIVLDLLSLIWGFRESCAIVASFHNQQMYPKMCSIDTFDNLQPVGEILNGGLLDPQFGG